MSRTTQLAPEPLLNFGGQSETRGRGRGLNPGANVQLAQDRGDVIVDGPFGENEPLRDLFRPEPSRHELQYLQLPGREIRGIQPGGRSWTTGQAASPAPPKTSRDDRRCGLGPELLQLLERRPQRRLLVGVRERECRLVRAIQLAPCRRRLPPIARELQGVRRRSSIGAARGETLTTAPVSELSDQPRRTTIMRQFEGAVSLVSRLAEQPRDLGAGRRHRTEPSDLPVGAANAHASSSKAP